MILRFFLAGYGWVTFEAMLLFVGLLSIKVAEHLSLRNCSWRELPTKSDAFCEFSRRLLPEI